MGVAASPGPKGAPASSKDRDRRCGQVAGAPGRERASGEVVVNYRMMHGKTSPIKHDGKDLFAGMPNPFAATRYHSLVIKKETIPDCLEITAETDEGEIMGVKHKQYPIWGVQFHPESILTESGRTILSNFLKLG